MTVQVRSTTRAARRSKAAKQDHILQLHSGPHAGKFLVRINQGKKPDGKIAYKQYGPFAELGRAIEERDNHFKALKAKHVDMLPVGRQAKPMTLKEWSDHWLGVEIANSAATSTAAKYRSAFERYVLPDLGSVALVDLTAEGIGEWRETLKERVGAPSVRYALKRLKTCLTAAVTARRTTGLEANPATPVKGVRVKRKEHEGAPEDYPKLIAAAADHYLAAVIPFTVDSGLRCSEVCGLRWGDIDWDARTVTVTWHMINHGSNKMGNRVGALVPGSKTSGGKAATVQLSRRTIEVLRAHRERLRSMQGPGWKTGKASEYFEADHSGMHGGKAYVVPTDPGAEGALVFPAADGMPLPTNNMYGWFKRVGGKAGVSKSFHGMRHDCGSFMLSRLVPLAVVSRHLRHSDPAITAAVYTHLIREQERLGADTMDALWASLEAQEQAV